MNTAKPLGMAQIQFRIKINTESYFHVETPGYIAKRKSRLDSYCGIVLRTLDLVAQLQMSSTSVLDYASGTVLVSSVPKQFELLCLKYIYIYIYKLFVKLYMYINSRLTFISITHYSVHCYMLFVWKKARNRACIGETCQHLIGLQVYNGKKFGNWV